MAFDPVSGCPLMGTISGDTMNATSAMYGTEIGYSYGLEWQPFGDAYAISSGPMNAMNIIFNSQVQYN